MVRDGRIQPATEKAAQNLLLPPDDFFAMANSTWDKKLAEAGN